MTTFAGIDPLALSSCMECFEDAPRDIQEAAALVPADEVKTLSPKWTRTRAVEGAAPGLLCRACIQRDTLHETERVKIRRRVGEFCDALADALRPGGAR